MHGQTRTLFTALHGDLYARLSESSAAGPLPARRERPQPGLRRRVPVQCVRSNNEEEPLGIPTLSRLFVGGLQNLTSNLYRLEHALSAGASVRSARALLPSRTRASRGACTPRACPGSPAHAPRARTSARTAGRPRVQHEVEQGRLDCRWVSAAGETNAIRRSLGHVIPSCTASCSSNFVSRAKQCVRQAADAGRYRRVGHRPLSSRLRGGRSRA